MKFGKIISAQVIIRLLHAQIRITLIKHHIFLIVMYFGIIKKIIMYFFNPCNALYFDVFFRADTKISRNCTLSVCVVAHSWPKFGWIERTLDFGLKRPISLGFYSDKFVCRNDMLMFWCQSIEHKKLHKTLRLQLELMIS